MQAAGTPRLTPIEQPEGRSLKRMYRLASRDFGIVPMLMKVLYARRPMLQKPSACITSTLRSLSLEPGLRSLITYYGSQLNGCSFCCDIAAARAVRAGLGTEKFVALLEGPEAAAFSERERAVLRYVQRQIVDRRVPDDVFEGLRQHFTEEEIVEIVWATAAIGYLNAIAAPLHIGSDGLQTIAELEKSSAET